MVNVNRIAIPRDLTYSKGSFFSAHGEIISRPYYNVYTYTHIMYIVLLIVI